MKKLGRWTLNVLIVLSLLLGVAASIQWVTSSSRPHPRALIAWGHYSYLDAIGGDLCFTHQSQMGTYRQSPPKIRDWGAFGYGVYRMEFSPSQVVWGATLPLWPMAILGPVPAVFAIRRARHVREMERRASEQRCIACSYDLTGNVSGVCPECGTKLAGLPPCPRSPSAH